MKQAYGALAVTALAVAFASNASAAAPKSASLEIDHLVRGCHSWSLNGNPQHVHQIVQLARNGSLLVTNDDLMIQDLVRTSGPAVHMQLVRQSHMGKMQPTMPMNGNASRYAMNHMGAQVKVTFANAGTYHFKLIDRGDYFDNIKTIGPDNQPTVTVTVS